MTNQLLPDTAPLYRSTQEVQAWQVPEDDTERAACARWAHGVSITETKVQRCIANQQELDDYDADVIEGNVDPDEIPRPEPQERDDVIVEKVVVLQTLSGETRAKVGEWIIYSKIISAFQLMSDEDFSNSYAPKTTTKTTAKTVKKS